MHIVVVLLLLLLTSLTARAQPRTQVALHGTVIDSASRQALPQATALLRLPTDYQYSQSAIAL